MLDQIPLDKSWREALYKEFSKTYYLQLQAFLKKELESGNSIYPPLSKIFAALNITPLENVRVVILGQDPYHCAKQANGLSFSVEKETPLPPSLKNIFKELKDDLVEIELTHGDLTGWAKQGVLLLNSVLTVRDGEADSHKDHGWEEFTDRIIQILNSEKVGLVFVLWGKSAQLKGGMIDDSKHLVLKAPHPSPLSAYRGFFGSKPFSKINDYLLQNESKQIDWKIV